MKNKKEKTEDINLLASRIVTAVIKTPSSILKPEKNPAAVSLGRLGGLKGGKARAAKLSAKKRKEIARNAARARWSPK